MSSTSPQHVVVKTVVDEYDEYILDCLWRACCDSQTAFLEQLELASDFLGLPEADRSYRSQFTENYAPLFSLAGRCYRAELFDACMSQAQDLTVNGTHYLLSTVTVEKSMSLLYCVQKLLNMLKQWSSTPPAERFLPDFKPLLTIVDEAWAEFEYHYITDLIEIEAKAREPFVRATFLERELQALERRSELDSGVSGAKKRELPAVRNVRIPVAQNFAKQRLQSGDGSAVSKTLLASPASRTLRDEYALPSMQCSTSDLTRLAETASKHWAGSPLRIVLQKLVEQIAELNASANIQGRGRADLDLRVLETAAEVFLSSETSERDWKERDGTSSASKAARRLLASQVLSGFVEIRVYLTEVSNRLIFVDPQLSNNETLVARLTKWEESWELGARFLLQPDLLEALCGVAGRIGHAPRFAPELTGFLENQDVELFLILPRLVLLCAFVDPVLMALPASLLPHHFTDANEAALSCEMLSLIQQFHQVCTNLSPTERQDFLSQSSWQVLVQKAMTGPGEGLGTTGHEAAVEKFLHRLEGFSMELQRHAPESWNQCCSILTQCVDAVVDSSHTQRSSISLRTATI